MSIPQLHNIPLTHPFHSMIPSSRISNFVLILAIHDPSNRKNNNTYLSTEIDGMACGVSSLLFFLEVDPGCYYGAYCADGDDVGC